LGLNSDIDPEIEIKIKKYSSTFDKEFSKLESIYNYLTFITFKDFIYVLNNYSLETAVNEEDYNNKELKLDRILTDNISIDEFQSFVENKIFKHPVVIYKLNEISNTICKDNLLEIYKSLNKKLIQFDKENGKNEENNRIKKYNILAFGVLYCNGTNISKIKNIFEIFKNKSSNNIEKDSKEFNDFILSLCLIPAYCTIYSRNKLGNYTKELGEIQTDLLKKILDKSELKDSVNLYNIIINRMFPENKKEIDVYVWKSLFENKENGIGFILNPKGIRNMIELNNV
jgi:hypothetical protein